MAEPINKAIWEAIAQHTGEYWDHQLQAAEYGNGDSFTVECTICGVVVAEVTEEEEQR